MLDDVFLLPGVADPNITDVLGSVVPDTLADAVDDLVLVLGKVCREDGENTLLAAGLVLVVNDKDGESGGGKRSALLLGQVGDGSSHILEELRVGILERGSRVIDLVNDEHVLAKKTTGVLALLDLAGTLVAADSLGVEPLGSDDLVTNLTLGSTRDLFVEAEADSLDGDVAELGGVEAAGLLEEGSEHTGGVESTTTNGNHEIRVKLALDLASGLTNLDVNVLVGGSEVVVGELVSRHCERTMQTG